MFVKDGEILNNTHMEQGPPGGVGGVGDGIHPQQLHLLTVFWHRQTPTESCQLQQQKRAATNCGKKSCHCGQLPGVAATHPAAAAAAATRDECRRLSNSQQPSEHRPKKPTFILFSPINWCRRGHLIMLNTPEDQSLVPTGRAKAL